MFTSLTNALDRFAAPAILTVLLASLPLAALTFVTNTTAF